MVTYDILKAAKLKDVFWTWYLSPPSHDINKTTEHMKADSPLFNTKDNGYLTYFKVVLFQKYDEYRQKTYI